MNKTETANQLRLAAELIETGHPFEVRHETSEKWHPSKGVNPAGVVPQNWYLRPILATPPDNRPLHNPDGLSAEQVGLGYRLGLQEESADQPHAYWGGEWLQGTPSTVAFGSFQVACRLPLTSPWPEAKHDPYDELKAAHAAGKVIQEDFFGAWHDVADRDPNWSLAPWLLRIKPDPYAELKAAHAAGKVIEVFVGDDEYGPDRWSKKESNSWTLPPEKYRVKPEPAFQLPPPPPGMKWHREDGWKEGDLPQGYRPFTDGEKRLKGDEYRTDSRPWGSIFYDHASVLPSGEWFRTTRPLIFTHEGKEWTYHRPGDPMPCDGERRVCILMGIGAQTTDRAKSFRWTQLRQGSDSDIIGWRYAETTKQAELGPEDVLPLSVIRRKGEKQNWHWRLISYVHGTHAICADRAYEWSELERDYEINRSIPLTGRWNPDAWEPCYKTLANG